MRSAAPRLVGRGRPPTGRGVQAWEARCIGNPQEAEVEMHGHEPQSRPRRTAGGQTAVKTWGQEEPAQREKFFSVIASLFVPLKN